MGVKVRHEGAWVETGGGGDGSIPSGGIIMWSGTIATIPSGWALCDGNNGTPDLRNKFIVGANNSTGDTTYPGLSPGATGGSANAVLIAHSHDTVLDNKNVQYEGSAFSMGPGNQGATRIATNDLVQTTGINASGVSDATQTGTNANLPPYYALAYIMKT